MRAAGLLTDALKTLRSKIRDPQTQGFICAGAHESRSSAASSNKRQEVYSTFESTTFKNESIISYYFIIMDYYFRKCISYYFLENSWDHDYKF